MPAFVLRTTRPLRRPLKIGEKSIAIAHVPEAVTGFEIEQVVLGSSAKSPLVVTPVMFSELVPVLVKVTDFAAAVVPTTVLPKVRLEGFNDTPGAVPVPLSVTVCVPPLALSVMVTTPLRVPLAVGVNVTAIVHVPEAAIGVEIEQVVPAPRAKSPLAVRAVMESELAPVLVRVTDCAAAVVPTTVLPKVRPEGFSDTPTAVPLPVSVTICMPPLASSLMVTTLVRVPLAVGVNVTAIVQVSPAVTGVEVEQVVPVPRAKSPLAINAVMFRELVPVLVKVTDCAAAVVPTTVLPKVRLDGVSVTPGAIAEPLSVTVCVPPPALSEIVTTPVRVPLLVGVKVTATVQLPPAAIGVEVEQVPVPTAKSPLAASAEIVSGLLPVLVNVADCAAAVVPKTVLPKLRLDGFSDAPGVVPVPLKLMFWIPPLASSVIVIPPVRTPLAVGVKATAIVQL